MFRISLAAAAALVAVACGPAESPEPAAPSPEPEPVAKVESEADEASAPAAGRYTCRITLAGEAQPESACEIAEGDVPDSLWLETLDGDLWISGEVTPGEGEGFELAGDVFCPQGACDEPLDASFERTGPGAYQATAELSAGELVIELSR